MDAMQSGSTMELRCYAYWRGAVWEAICTDLDVATCGSSQEEVKRLLAEAIDLHLESVAGFPEEDRQAMLSRRAPWNVRFGLELLSRVHGIRSKWGKGGEKGGEKVRHSFVVHPEIPASEWAERNEVPIDDAEEQRRSQVAALIGAVRDESLQAEDSSRRVMRPPCLARHSGLKIPKDDGRG